jgi:hypothetical protein
MSERLLGQPLQDPLKTFKNKKPSTQGLLGWMLFNSCTYKDVLHWGYISSVKYLNLVRQTAHVKKDILQVLY